MPDDPMPFLLVHGFWHRGSCWDGIAQRLRARGHAVEAPDLPGAGSRFVPGASVTQADRTAAIVALLERSERPVVLVGHSMGGATIAAAAEAVPDRVAALILVTAFAVPPGERTLDWMAHETMRPALVAGLLTADPASVGVLRIDPGSSDPAYRRDLAAAFYGDVPLAAVADAVAALHPEEPADAALRPWAGTAARLGTVQRHYVRCLADRAIPIAGQDAMVAATDAALGTRTSVHTLDASHSPFLSRPDELAEIMAGVASGAERA